MIKTIFFDMDDTLYYEKHAKIKAELQTTEYIVSQTGLDFDAVYSAYYSAKWAVINGDDKNPDRNNRTKWYESMLRSLHITKITADELSGNYWKVVISNIEPYYDAQLALPQLARQYDLYILTDELMEICEEKLKTLGLCEYFKDVISSAHVGMVKPHKELFDYALKVADAMAETSIMVGDNPARDILGGNMAGMTTALLHRGQYFYYPQTGGEKADIVIDNYVNFARQIKEYEEE